MEVRKHQGALDFRLLMHPNDVKALQDGLKFVVDAGMGSGPRFSIRVSPHVKPTLGLEDEAADKLVKEERIMLSIVVPLPTHTITTDMALSQINADISRSQKEGGDWPQVKYKDRNIGMVKHINLLPDIKILGSSRSMAVVIAEINREDAKLFAEVDHKRLMAEATDGIITREKAIELSKEFAGVGPEGETRPERVNITGCARCGADHEKVRSRPFIRPMVIMGVEYTHWASCPETGEPILVIIPKEGDKDDREK